LIENFLPRQRQHRQAEIGAHRPALGIERQCDIAGAGADIQGQPGLDSSHPPGKEPAPPAVLTQGQNPVEQIVTMGDSAEHATDLGTPLGTQFVTHGRRLTQGVEGSKGLQMLGGLKAGTLGGKKENTLVERRDAGQEAGAPFVDLGEQSEPTKDPTVHLCILASKHPSLPAF